jgi:N-acetylmuramoyl-L-alanine amidase
MFSPSYKLAAARRLRKAAAIIGTHGADCRDNAGVVHAPEKMMLKIQDAPIQSASFHVRKEPIDTLVLHYTAIDLAASLKVLRNGAVSVHYVLAEDGTAYRILQDAQVGYHAGLSTWRGRPRVNERSIGIEIVNLDGNVHAYPPVQINALIALIKQILAAHPLILPGNIVGHSDIAPKRKVDPGKLFPWKALVDAGLGRWPNGAVAEPVGTEAAVQALLEQCGYPAPHAYGEKNGGFVYVPDSAHPLPGVTNIVRVTTSDILRAFQLRYLPASADGKITPVTMGLLRKLASMP